MIDLTKKGGIMGTTHMRDPIQEPRSELNHVGRRQQQAQAANPELGPRRHQTSIGAMLEHKAAQSAVVRADHQTLGCGIEQRDASQARRRVPQEPDAVAARGRREAQLEQE